MSKKMKLIFTISVLANILLLGVIGGKIYWYKMHKTSSWSEIKSTLAPETRDIMKQTFSAKKADIMSLYEDAREKKRALEDIFSAEEFDVDAFDRAALSLKETGIEMTDHKLNAFRELGQKLPQAERAKLSKRLSSGILGRHNKTHKDKKICMGEKGN